jgi:hypothetical protein
MVGSSTKAPGKSATGSTPLSVRRPSDMLAMPGANAPSATVNAVMAAAPLNAAAGETHNTAHTIETQLVLEQSHKLGVSGWQRNRQCW